VESRPVTLVVEGDTDAFVARRLIAEHGLQVGPQYVQNGKHALDQRLAGYNSAARHSCWLVLRDLDHDAACAPELRQKLLSSPAPHMRLHIVVRAIEAWLVADAERVARFLSVAASAVPRDPERIEHPKRALVDLARRSRRSTIRGAMVPAPGTTAGVGPGYAVLVAEFTNEHWRPDVAATRSESLARLCHMLRRAAAHPEPC